MTSSNKIAAVIAAIQNPVRIFFIEVFLAAASSAART
jgi:hypothetical protein